MSGEYPKASREPAMTIEQRRIDIAQERHEAWVDVIVKQLPREVSVEWKQWQRAADRYGITRKLWEVKGEAYWIPAREDGHWPGRGHVYARHDSGFNSYGIDFESDDTFTPDDLLNLASAAYDGMYWPHDIDASRTSPFRPFS